MFSGLSREKINHISKELIERLEADEEISLLKPANDVRLRLEETIDDEVTRTLQSYGRKIPEGSPEWEILYRKHHEEELVRRGLK